MQPKVLLLHANGTNRDHELAQAFTLAGAAPEIKHLHELYKTPFKWDDYQILALPGGFSYGDTLGAGRLLAMDLNLYFHEQIHQFVQSGKPVIGICNGFQALIKSGILPDSSAVTRPATLTFNEQGSFECRWVTLLAQSRTCLWTQHLQEAIYCPVAHGEGRLVLAADEYLPQLQQQQQIAFIYANTNGTAAMGAYPTNPNGSTADIAGICNAAGNVLGLMPHPENHIFSYQHPRWTRGEHGNLGLSLFTQGVKYVA